MEKMDEFKRLIVATIEDVQDPIGFLKTIRFEIRNSSFRACGDFLRDYYESQIVVIDLLLKEME